MVGGSVPRGGLPGRASRGVGAALRGVLLVGALLVGVAACGVPAPGTPVPSFPAASETAGTAGGPGLPDGSTPTDCNAMLAVDDLNALLGLPLGSVAVRTTIGVAEPSVGRTERVLCRYTGVEGSPARGRLLDLNVARYTDPAAAGKQWGTNAGVESGERRDLPIGAARAALFERSAETVLMVTYDDDTLTFVLTEGPRPPGRSRADVLIDLALRVLPTVGPPRTATPPQDASTPPTSTPGPAVAAG